MDLHRGLYVADGCQYSNWSPERFQEMQDGGLDLLVATVVYWENARETLALVADWNRRFQAHSDIMTHVKSGAGLREARDQRRMGVVLGAQNCSPIEEDLGLVQVMRDLGLAIMQLTYNNQSLIGAGCYEDNDSGLSRFGREVISEMNRVGMIVDLSHTSERTSLEAIDYSSRPVCISHANPLFYHESIRNKSNRVLKALADRGGLLGFSLYPLHLKDKSEAKISDFCSMVRTTADRIGIERIGIGSDLCLGWPYETVEWMRNGRWTHTTRFGEGDPAQSAWPAQPSWFQSSKDYPNISQALSEAGFTQNEIRKVMGENWFEFLSQGLAPAAGA
jgi:microsomal dipeptidase-like Zn-dependent dipeptidase